MIDLTVLNLGAGVQSSTVLLMAEAGELPRPDVAIFADTGWEPTAVYDWLAELETLTTIPVERVAAGNIRDAALETESRFVTLPVHIRNCDGTQGLGRRLCTKDFKIRPITKRITELVGGNTRGKDVEQWFGISIDEAQRMRIPSRKYLTYRYPLIEDLIPPMTRHDCRIWLHNHGHNPPRSACIGCPFHSDSEWRHLRDTDPDGWADAIDFDKQIRNGITRPGRKPMNGTQYLHRQRVPLDQADLTTAEDHGQINLFGNECEGMCGV